MLQLATAAGLQPDFSKFTEDQVYDMLTTFAELTYIIRDGEVGDCDDAKAIEMWETLNAGTDTD